MNEDLRKWFSQKWVRMDTKGNIKGDCAREDGEGKPKCLPLAKAQSMDKEDRAAAARRKRREDPVADRSGKGGKPINVATEEVSTSELIKKSHSKRGSPGTLKAKINGPITLEKVRALKNRNNATTLDKKQANFYINMHSEEYLEEKNVPTNPGLWARAKSLARSKFDVYPSAYANGWAAKWYKGKGGGWKSVQEGKQMKSLKDILSEGVAVSSDFKLVNSVNAQGKPITRKVRAHRKTISPDKMESEEKSDVMTSIQKFVGRQYDEEVESVAEAEKNPHTSALGKALYRDLSKEKKASPQQVKKNKARLAQRQADKEPNFGTKDDEEENQWWIDYDMKEGVAEGSLDEVSQQTLHSYRKKASAQKRAADDVVSGDADDETWKKNVSLSAKRRQGINAANKRLGVVEGAEQVDEIDMSKTLAAFNKGKPEHAQAKIDTRTTAERKAETEKMLSARAAAKPKVIPKSIKPSTPEQQMKNQNDAMAKSYANNKRGQYVGDSVELTGTPIVEVRSAAARLQLALQKARKQREEEEARKAANEKRALTPKPTNEAKDPREYDYEGDMAKTQLRSIIANSQAVHDMLKDTTNLAEWVQSKITKAEDYISTVADYMTAEMNESKEEDDDEDYNKHHKLDPDSGVEADQHIHVQLKKAIDSTMKPYEVTFKNGKKHSVSSPVAKTIVTAVEKLKPEHRKTVHDELHKSYDSLMGVHKAITGK